MNLAKRLLMFLAAALVALGAGGCDDGPFQKAGKSIDQAGEKAEDKIKDVTK